MSFRIKKITIAITLALSINNSQAQFDPIFELQDITAQSGIVFRDVPRTFSLNSTTVSKAGDVNGDGIDDLIIGAAGLGQGGVSYLVYGSANALPPNIDLTTLNGSNGYTLVGQNFDYSGFSVGAGDINGDGLSDLIIGARFAGTGNAQLNGRTIVVFGSLVPPPNPFSLNGFTGVNGFTINGKTSFDYSGSSVSVAGDVNNDGIDDLLIGAPGRNSSNMSGSSYVVYGSEETFPASFDLNDINALNGFSLNGIDADDGTGNSVSNAGDINGDGIDDLIVGSSGADPNGNDSAGSSYVVFGSDGILPNPFNLINLNGNNGFAIHGISSSDNAGFSVSAAGDVNGDGFDDIIVGAPGVSLYSGFNNGSSYVVFGSDNDFPHPFNLTTINGQNGFVINGSSNFRGSGNDVSSAGDVNGDGINDILIGSLKFATVSIESSCAVVFGTTSGFPSPLNISDLNGNNGFLITKNISSIAFIGRSVSAAGDVNNDGIDDILIGTFREDNGGFFPSERAYLIYGNDGIFSDGFEN